MLSEVNHFVEIEYSAGKGPQMDRGPFSSPFMRLWNQSADLSGVSALFVFGIYRCDDEVVGSSGLDRGVGVRRCGNWRTVHFCVRPAGLT